MPDPIDDPELLRRYAEERSESAFAELVRRHLHFVFGLALRRGGGDARQAEAAARVVFTALAQDAAALAGQPLLTGWLHARTLAAVAEIARSERRRSPVAADAPTDAGLDWARDGGTVDAALGQLGELDREALLLRVFRQYSWEVVAAKLSLTESAVRMRVERALGRIAAALGERGVAVTPAAAEQALARVATVSMPSGLIPKIANESLEAAAGARAPLAQTPSGSRSGILAGVVAAVALGGLIVAGYQAAEARSARARLAESERAAASLALENRALQERLQAEARRTQAADEDNARLLEAVTSIATSLPRRSEAAAATAPADAITPESVLARFRRAGEWARADRPADALGEYLWCYDEGMPRFASFAGVRTSVLARAIADLGRQYPPALAALRERRDRAEQRLLTAAGDREGAVEYAELNEVLGDSARTVAQFEKLPDDDIRRQALGARLREAPVEPAR